MDLSPFAAQGGQSHFRGENVNSPVTSFPPRKSGQSPVNGYLPPVSVTAWMGTGPFFGGKSCLAQKTQAENMDLSLFAAQGGQSHFRGENVNSPVTSFPPRKSGQSPVNGYLPPVSVTAWMGTGPFFGGKSCLA